MDWWTCALRAGEGEMDEFQVLFLIAVVRVLAVAVGPGVVRISEPGGSFEPIFEVMIVL